MTDSDDRAVAEFRANDGVVLGIPGGVVLLHGGPTPRWTVPVAAVLEGGAWLVARAPGVEGEWAQALRVSPDASVETATGSLDVHAIELDLDEAQPALERFGAAVRAPVFRLEPRG